MYARKCYRKMLGIKQANDHVTNEDLYKRVKMDPISTIIRVRQMSFTGHCLRMDKPDIKEVDKELAYIYMLYESKINKTNRVGRPRKSYFQQISEYMVADKQVGISVEEIKRQATESKGEKWKDRYCRLPSEQEEPETEPGKGKPGRKKAVAR